MTHPTDSLTVALDDTGITVRGEHIDPYARTATRRLRELLGPEIQTTVAGVDGTGRTAHWLESGVVVVSDDYLHDELVMLFVCFDEKDSSPYPHRLSTLPPFHGSVRCAEYVFSGGEADDAVQQIPNLRGYGGMRSVKLGQLLVGFDLRKPLSPYGRRVGRRRLVQMSAEWGGVKPFTKKAVSVSEPWAD
jgi:hypothetical protein